MGYDVSGKTALVTGANRGIGEAIVDALVTAGVGKVYTGARSLSALGPLVARHGSRVVPLQFDVTNTCAGRRRRGDRGGRGPPGQQRGHRRLLRWRVHRIRSGIEGGRQEMEVNFLGTFAVTQAFAPGTARRMAAAPSPTSTRWPRSSASRFSRRTAPRRPRRGASLRSPARCYGDRTHRCLACIPARLTPGWAR